MANILCIDQGNSLTKACVFSGGKIVANDVFSPGEAEAGIDNWVKQYQPEGAIVCSVTNHHADIMLSLRDAVPYVHRVDENSHLPIMNAYGSPQTLGADRIALAVGAQAGFPDSNVLVVSVGTCVTYNFVQKNKAFRGGLISPGMNMRLKAMHEFTDKLPLVSAEGDSILLGYDTETSMRSGAVNGLAAEIDGLVAAFAEQYPDFNAVLTGGDGPLFANKLKSKIFADPHLLMKGLQIILKHNVPQLQ
ncbi:MAG TPA: type III pantothenate kinase [Flavipsychrobacter sp.]|nr:type III pantothenate kinase [Flavipsychrobacter sp.]